MIFPKTKLKNQLVIINALSKLLIIVLAIFVIPQIVSRISIDKTDEQLIDKLDQMYELIDEWGIEEFIGAEDEIQSFGSYNILKEEYVSIEPVDDTLLYEYIDNSQRIVEEEIYDYRVISATFELDGQVYLIEIGKSITSIINFDKELKRFAFYFLLILLSLTIIFDLSVIKLLLKPFDRIIQKLKLTTHPTGFDYKTVSTSTTDFIYLEESIHSLMRKIEAAFNEERETIGNISHELLTPISIIRSKLENFVNETKLSDEELIRIIESKATLGRLTKLVRTLLMMSRIENEEYLRNQKIELGSLVNQVVEEVKERLDIKQLKLNLAVGENQYVFNGNQDLLHILFFNIINNAIKYTPEGGKIQINGFQKKDEYVVKIADNGKGIAKEHLPHIFTRFKKFSNGESNFGLGLALSKKICDYHRINIRVDSVTGKGSSFTLLFPLN